jgi:hypothetical protein
VDLALGDRVGELVDVRSGVHARLLKVANADDRGDVPRSVEFS